MHSRFAHPLVVYHLHTYCSVHMWQYCVHMNIYPQPVFKIPTSTEMNLHVSKHMCIYKYMQRMYINMSTPVVVYIHAPSYFFFGVGFESALDPERPFSVLSIPDEVTRHSLLHWGGRKRQEDKVRPVNLQQLKEMFQACII